MCVFLARRRKRRDNPFVAHQSLKARTKAVRVKNESVSRRLLRVFKQNGIIRLILSAFDECKMQELVCV